MQVKESPRFINNQKIKIKRMMYSLVNETFNQMKLEELENLKNTFYF